MNYQSKLKSEIISVLDDLTESNQDWNATFIAQLVCDNHKHELVNDAEFSLYNIYTNVRREVTSVINKLAGDKPEKESLQLIIPGYENLQTHYVVKRNGESIGVHIDNMTDDEIDEKTKVYKKMGTTCFAHADELQQYKVKRQQKVKATV